MTREEWSQAQPVLTRTLFLPPEDQKAAIESAFVEDAIRRELLELLRRTHAVLPPRALSAAGSAAGASSQVASPSGVAVSQAPLLGPGQSTPDGRFVVVRQLGRGGMGEVYLAHDRTLGNLVALKVLYHGEVREAQHARLCSGHPHIVTMHDAFEASIGEGARTVLVMEYVAGKPASRIVDDGAVPLREAVRWARHVAAAMAHAHDRGVLHCDLKPANILVTPDEGAKVLDFGIGRATFERTNPSEPLRGTAAYMAPEQLLERQFSEAGDIYSLGVTLFELVTGRLPFEGTTPEVMLQIVGAPAPRASSFRSSVPPALDDLLSRTLEKHPRDRYRTARALDRALEEVEQELITLTSPVPAPLIAPIPPPRIGPWTYVGHASAAVAVLTILGFVSSTALDSVLGRTGAFRSDTPLTWPIWGAKSLTAPLVLTALAAVIVANLAPLFRIFGKVPGTELTVRFVSYRFTAAATSTVAQALLAANVGALVFFLWYFRDLFRALTAFSLADPAADIGLLGPQHYQLQNSYRQGMTALLAVFGFAWYRLVRRRTARGERGPLPALWGGGIVMALTLLLNVMPYQVFYGDDAEQVTFRGQRCSLLGELGADVLLFCPLQSPRSRRVPATDPDLHREGWFAEIFAPLDPNAAPTLEP